MKFISQSHTRRTCIYVSMTVLDIIYYKRNNNKNLCQNVLSTIKYK